MLSFPRGPCKKILLGEVTFKSKFLESFFCTQGIRAIRGGAFFFNIKPQGLLKAERVALRPSCGVGAARGTLAKVSLDGLGAACTGSTGCDHGTALLCPQNPWDL